MRATATTKNAHPILLNKKFNKILYSHKATKAQRKEKEIALLGSFAPLCENFFCFDMYLVLN